MDQLSKIKYIRNKITFSTIPTFCSASINLISEKQENYRLLVFLRLNSKLELNHIS